MTRHTGVVRTILGLSLLLALTLVPAALQAQAAPAPAKAPAGGEKLVPIPVQLPKPMFEGTPQNLSVPNLQKPLGRPRDPFLAPAGVTNVAKGKKVTSSGMEPVIGELEQVTDGDKKGAEGSFVELGPGVQWVAIDLGAPQFPAMFGGLLAVMQQPDFLFNRMMFFEPGSPVCSVSESEVLIWPLHGHSASWSTVDVVLGRPDCECCRWERHAKRHASIF